VINICPEVLEKFTSKRECTIPVGSMLHILNEPRNRLGFVVAEQYDFGSAKTINALFLDLLGVTLFSKDEMARYSEFLSDRNLLVHHGGVITYKYASAKYEKKVSPRVHFDSIIIGTVQFRTWVRFVEEIAKKLGTITKKALEKYVKEQKIKLSRPRREAVRFLEKW
jgi:hypothetical protein